jgi:plasmid stability protein
MIPDIIDPMKRITVDLPDELYERLRLAAYAEHRSASAVVRDRLAASLPDLPENGDEPCVEVDPRAKA